MGIHFLNEQLASFYHLTKEYNWRGDQKALMAISTNTSYRLSNAMSHFSLCIFDL